MTLTIRQSIVVTSLAVSIASCGSSAATPAAGGAATSSTAPASARSDNAVPPVLRSTIASTLKIDESKVVPPANFQKDLGADDLSMVELVMAYERVFKIRIPNADADRFKTVQDVINYLRKKNVLR